MGIVKIIGAVFVACVLNLLIKEYKREYAPIISICCTGVIFAFIVPYAGEIFARISSVSERLGVEGEYVSLAVKVIGISYITQLSCEICRDAGENALAVNMEFAGKIMLTAVCVPVISDLIYIVERILP